MKRLLCVVAMSAGLGACATTTSNAPKASAELAPTSGNNARGTVTFVQEGDKVALTAKVSGLAPGAHGFHIHEKGDCSSGDGMSAGGHFNPAGKSHGSLTTEHHAGDMPNITADASGNATVSGEVPGLTIGGGAADIVGKGLIVHRDPDDYRSQPAGNAGPRIACAVIRKA